MNILFLTMVKIDVEQRGIYSDLMRKFRNEGHNVYIVMPCERREGKPTSLVVKKGIECKDRKEGQSCGDVYTLSVRTLNVQKTSIIEKGLGQVSLEHLYKRAIRKYFADVKFDLITYSTPPITFTNVIEWVKSKNPNATTYLQLKDIFPQNAVDLGMMPCKMRYERVEISDILKFPIRFAKYLLYKQFRNKEKKLYKISDWIGCMSPANVKYVIEHNPEIDPEKVEICANSFEPQKEDTSNHVALDERNEVRLKFGLPLDKPVFFYGGNLGKPQGIPFLLECLKANCKREDCYFIVVGSGTEYERLDSYIKSDNPKNVSLFQSLPKDEYEKLANACDVGLIFLDYRFTIPNYPSRLLSCLMQRKPVIACTDPNSDIGKIAEENNYGFWAPSNNVDAFTKAVDKMLAADIKAMGERGYQFFLNNYTVEHTYDAIMRHFRK